MAEPHAILVEMMLVGREGSGRLTLYTDGQANLTHDPFGTDLWMPCSALDTDPAFRRAANEAVGADQVAAALAVARQHFGPPTSS